MDKGVQNEAAGERQPLLQPPTAAVDNIIEVYDAMTYKLPWLRGWGVLTVMHNTVFQNPAIWSVMMRLLFVAVVAGILSCMLTPDPHHIDTSKFAGITQVLNFFTGLMLSFFLSSSIGRWIHCVNSYLGVFDSIRNLTMQLHVLGAPRDRIDTCLRYGMLSTVFLVADLQNGFAPTLVEERAGEESTWNELEDTSPESSEFMKILPEERAAIENVGDRPWQMWLWIGSLIGRMAADGEIPGMATPTYGRIMQLLQTAQDHIREVRATVVIQMPFIYVHMLCVLVHITCVLLSISAGIAIGLSAKGIYLYRIHPHTQSEDILPTYAASLGTESLSTEIQTIICESLKTGFGVFLYQCFLDIGISVCTPMAACGDATIPAARLRAGLERDLLEARRLAENPLHWKKPQFKVSV